MSSEWPKKRLAEISEVITGFPFKGDMYLPPKHGVRVVRGDNVTERYVRWGEKEKCWTGVSADLKHYVLHAGDVVIGMDGSKVGKNFAAISANDDGALLAQRVARVRAREGVSQDYLRYLICNDSFTEYVKAVHTGTSIPHISKGQIEHFQVNVPPLKVQCEISEILTSLDDRISLLRDTNATLEAIAQALFKSWFVDFDPVRAKAEGRAPEGMDEATASLFPDSFEDTELGVVPRGWHFAPLRDEVDGVYDGPHATPPDATEGGIFLGIKNLTGTSLDLGDARYIADADWERWTKRVTPRSGDIVFSYEATLGFFALIPPDLRCCLGRRLALVRPKPVAGTPHFWFHQFISGPFQALLDKHTIHGATVNRLALKSFPDLKVLVPPIELRRAFDSVVGTLWERIHNNSAMVTTITSLRDTLLPRLISGQLRLPETKQQAEDVLA